MALPAALPTGWLGAEMSFFFDTRAVLAKIENQPKTPATPATSATQPPKTRSHVADEAKVAGPVPEFEQSGSGPDPRARPASAAPPYGQSVGGRPLTWTGRVVSLDEWRGLSDWDRDGETA